MPPHRRSNGVLVPLMSLRPVPTKDLVDGLACIVLGRPWLKCWRPWHSGQRSRQFSSPPARSTPHVSSRPVIITPVPRSSPSAIQEKPPLSPCTQPGYPSPPTKEAKLSPTPSPSVQSVSPTLPANQVEPSTPLSSSLPMPLPLHVSSSETQTENTHTSLLSPPHPRRPCVSVEIQTTISTGEYHSYDISTQTLKSKTKNASNQTKKIHQPFL